MTREYALGFSDIIIVNVRPISLFLIQGKRTADFTQPAQAFCSGPGYQGEKGDLVLRAACTDVLTVCDAFLKCAFWGTPS